MTEPSRGRRRPKPAGPTPAPGPPAPLSESELGYSALLEQAGDAIFITNAGFRVLYANARGCEMFGFSREELERMSAGDLMSPNELSVHPIETKKLRQGGPVTTYRHLRRKDGTLFTAEINARLLDGGRIVVIVRDITERLDVERRLAASEARYGAVFEHATVGIAVTDRDWRFVEVNPRACEIFGRSREEMLGLTVRQLSAPGEPEVFPLQEEMLRAGRDSFATRLVQRPDGPGRIVEIGARGLADGHVVSVVTDVTERIEAERRLAESEARYTAVIERATVGITVTDAQWRFVEVNPRACEIFGRAREELLRLTVRDIAAPGELQGAPLREPELRAGLDSFATRRISRPDGTVRVVEISARDLGGGLVVSVVTDVTERIEAERRLAASEARYGAVVEQATVGITVTDLDWRFVELNPRACEIFGYSREELLGMRVFELAGPGDPGVGAAEMEALRSGGVVHGMRRVRRPDGTERFIEISARVLGGEQVVSVVTDVTERVEAERRLAESELDLARAQELAHFGTWEVDLKAYVAHWSPETYRIFGVPPETRPVTYERYMDCLHPEDRARVQRLLGEIIEGGAVPRDYEHRLLRADGSVRVLHSTIDARRDAAGKVVRLMGSAQDVTEVRLLELQLREAQKLEAIGRLAGGVAHDFNNLLTVILGFAETMLDAMPPGDRHRSSAEQIRLAARRAAGLTQQLLAFGRRQMFRLEVFDLNAVLAENQEILRRLIGEQIEISVSPGARHSHIRADRGQIEQVILNLALNARDAMPSGGQLEIATTNVPPPADWTAGPCVLLTVSDTGMGMLPEVQAHIFEPFYTTKDVGQGTGLGLATVHGIVSQTGGRIEVVSRPGEGTRFLIHLPCAPAAAAPAAAAPAAAAPAVPDEGGDETVLLVEDDASVRSLVAEVLRRRGYHVLEALDGDEAVGRAGQHAGPLHLLITDVVMPGMSGPDLVRRLLELRPGLRALLISGYGGERAAVDGPPAGSVAFLQKPFTPATIARRVRELLDLPGAPGPGGGPGGA